MLKVHIKRAKNLPIGDFVTSDPFVKVFCSNPTDKFYFGKTFWVGSTLDPDWEKAKPDKKDKLVFSVPACLCESLIFEIFDHDFLTSDDFLGHTEVKVSDIKFNTEMELPLLQNQAGDNSTLTVLVTRYDDILMGEGRLESINGGLSSSVEMSDFSKFLAFIEVPEIKQNPVLKVRTTNHVFDSIINDIAFSTGIIANKNSFTRVYTIDKVKIMDAGEEKLIIFYLENFGPVVLSDENPAKFILVGVPQIKKTSKMQFGKLANIMTASHRPKVVFATKITSYSFPYIIKAEGDKIKLVWNDTLPLSDVTKIEEKIYSIQSEGDYSDSMNILNKIIGETTAKPLTPENKEKRGALADLCIVLADMLPSTMSQSVADTLRKTAHIIAPD